MVAFVVVPQWQGSGSSRALQLVDGAEAIRGELPRTGTREIVVPIEAGENQGTGVHRITSLCTVRDELTAFLRETNEPVITIGGDCGVDLAPITSALGRWGERLGVVWFDAHPDLHTPASSPSHAFHGMVLRTLLGEGATRLVPEHTLTAGRVILAGARAWDDEELEFAQSSGIRSLTASELADSSLLISALESAGVEAVYLHIDLDVLDPSTIAGIGFAEPFGVSVPILLDAVSTLRARFPLAGASVTEFAPSSTAAAVEDLPTILRIVGALAGPPA